MNSHSPDTELDFLDDLDLQNLQLLVCSLKVFYYDHPPPPPRIEDIPYPLICRALSAIKFYGQLVFAKFWAAIDFGSCSVLTTRGQPFGFSMYTNEFWSNRIACLDQNSYVHPQKRVFIGIPGLVFLDRTTKWTQQQDTFTFFMPVIEADRCYGVLEISMTNPLVTCPHQVLEVCIALEVQGLQSSPEIENINIDPFEDRPLSQRSRASKLDHITCNDITKLFGLPKKAASEYLGVSENTFGKVHQIHGIEEWPCKRTGIVKSSAHLALITGAPFKHNTTLDKATLLKEKEYWLIQDNDDISCDWECNLVDEYMNYLISNEGERIEEQPNEHPQPVLLELYS